MFIADQLPHFDELDGDFFQCMYETYRECGLWDITEDNTDFVGMYYTN